VVGGDILRYSSKCLIELKKVGDGDRIAILRKHRSLPENKVVAFKIVEHGIEQMELPKEKESSADELFPEAS
jgi:DNA repair protein RadB